MLLRYRYCYLSYVSITDVVQLYLTYILSGMQWRATVFLEISSAVTVLNLQLQK